MASERNKHEIGPRDSDLLDIIELDCFRTEIPPSKIPTNEDRDHWDIKALSFNMQSVSHPSQFLENFIKNHQQQFEEIVTTMHVEIGNENERTELCIRTVCETFKFKLDEVEKTVEDWKSLISSGKLPLTSVMMEEHEILNFSLFKNLLSNRAYAIEDFYSELVAIENNRVKENVRLLRDNNIKLSKLGVKMPAEVRELIEMEILNINQMTLNNMRYYEDLKKTLLLRGEKLECMFREYLDKCQKMFAEKLLQKLQAKIKKDDADKEFFDSQEGKDALNSLYASRNLITNLIKQQFGHTRFSTEDVEVWTVKIQRAAAELDETAKKVIDLYKKITYNLFQGRISELESFINEYMNIKDVNIEKGALMNDLQIKIFKPVLDKKEEHITEVSKMEEQWRELMSEMQNMLQATYKFLIDSSKIWDRHFRRTQEAKTMILMRITAVTAEHTVDESELEMGLNIAIDSLRQEPTEEKLQYTLHRIFDLLSGLEEQYGKHYAEKQESLEKFSAIMSADVKILQSEIEKFLEIYPNEYFNDYFVRHQSDKLNTDGDVATDSTKVPPKSLPQELKKCQFQTDALKNWKLGLREAITYYNIVCEKEIDKDTRRWMDRQSETLTRNFELKLALLHGRYHRVKTEIYDLRRAELESHVQRFESHVLGVQQQIQELTDYATKVQNDQLDKINEEYNETLADFQDKGQKSESTVKIGPLMWQSENKLKSFNSRLDTVVQDFSNEIKNKINWIRKSNINYVKSLILFTNGGNFHPDEVQILSGELEKLTQDVESKADGFLTSAIDKEASLSQLVRASTDSLLQGFKISYEDMHFSEKVTAAVSRVREFIKKEVKHMKYNRKLLTSKVDLLCKELPDDGGVDLLSFVRDFWRPLLYATEQYYEYLLQPASTNTKSKVAGLRFTGFEAIAGGVKRQSAKKGPSALKNYVDFLFDNNNPPISGDSFLEKVCNCMWEVFQSLQEAAVDFYKTRKNTPIVKRDIIKPNISEFIEETLIRFKYYHLQCEEVWLEEVQEYFSLLARMKHACKAFSEKSILKFHTNRMDAVSAAHKIFVQKMDDLDKRHIDMRTVLSKKLKPLHGYPGNKDLLKKLSQEIKDGNTLMENETENHVKQYKKYLTDREKAYNADIKSLSSILLKLTEYLFHPARFSEKLEEQVDEVVERMNNRTYLPAVLYSLIPNYWSLREQNGLRETRFRARRKEAGTKEESKPIETSGPSNSEPKEEVKTDYRLSVDINDQEIQKIKEKYKKNTHSEKHKNMSKLKKSDERTVSEPDENVLGEEEAEDMELSPNISVMVALSEEEFEDYVRKYSLMASKYIASCNEEGKIWLKLFKKHAEKVKDLYTVRND